MRHAVLGITLIFACSHSPGSGLASDGGGGGPTDAGKSDAPAAGDARSTTDAGPCGTRSDRRGSTSRSATVAGLARTYQVYLPASVDPATPIPLVYVFHGYTMSGSSMISLTNYNAIADSEGVAVVYPDGQGGPNSLLAPWNVGSNVCPADFDVATPVATGDDMAFIDEMRADIEQDQCIDGGHVFATGFSMGGYMAHHIGCERPDFRAVAPHSGGTHDLSGCPNAIEPIIIFHGTGDPVIPDACDDPNGTAISGHEASAAAWAAHNGCASTYTTTTVENGSCIIYDGCPAGGQVELCTFTNMGHCWAGGSDGTIYACSTYASATALEWSFFHANAW